MFQPKNLDPIEVFVEDNRYEMFGAPTFRSAWLSIMLKRFGGINESVAPGVYHFNCVRKGLKLHFTLLPAN
jgi:hypothetical protein